MIGTDDEVPLATAGRPHDGKVVIMKMYCLRGTVKREETVSVITFWSHWACRSTRTSRTSLALQTRRSRLAWSTWRPCSTDEARRAGWSRRPGRSGDDGLYAGWNASLEGYR